MNINIVGTGDVFSERLSPCIVINKEVILDMPNGCTKELHKQDISLKDINIILISHFHADHCFDIPFFILEKNLEKNKKSKTTFIGPKGLNEHIDKLLNIAYPTIDWNTIKRNINYEVIETQKNFETIQIEKYKIKCLEVEHSQSEFCLGYIVSDEDKSVGYTGDSKLCNAIKYIVENSLICFADMSSEEPSSTHMGIKDIEYLNNLKNSNCIVYPVHTSNSALNLYYKKGYKFIKNGEKIVL